MFSDPHYSYTAPKGGASFNQIGGHESQSSVRRYSL